MRIGAVIVAAGMSTRMKQLKQLMRIGDMSLVERVVVSFQRAGVKDIIAVTGYRADEIEKELRRMGITFLRNPDYETTEMFDSAKLGLSYLEGRCDKVLFCPADIPFFTDETVRKMLEQEGTFVVPVYGGITGHPILIHQELIPKILSYTGDGGLRGALDSMDIEPVTVTVRDEGVVMDADTREDFRRLEELYDSRLMRPQVKVRLAKKKPFFGAGVVTLLHQIDRLGSVREACQKTGISYSKGWNMIRNVEEQMEYPVIERQHGGKNGGGAALTEKGKRLLTLFERYEKEVEQAAADIYRKIFLESD